MRSLHQDDHIIFEQSKKALAQNKEYETSLQIFKLENKQKNTTLLKNDKETSKIPEIYLCIESSLNSWENYIESTHLWGN